MQIQQHLMAAVLAGSLFAGAGSTQSAQASPVSPLSRTWSRTYGGSVSEQSLYDLRQLPGGQLLVAGSTASFGGPSQFNWFLKLELGSGDVQVQLASSSAFGGFTDGAAIAADGGALFLGRNVLDLFLKHDAWLERVDDTGNVLWSQGFTRPGTGRFFLFDAAELDDGSWIAVGASSLSDQPPQAAWIVRLTSAGFPLWQYEYGGGLVDTARSVTPTSDGGFAVAGWTNSSGAGSDDVWVMKIDADGAIQWQRTFGGLDTDQAEDLVELDDGGFAVVGSSNSLTPSAHAPWILRLKDSGDLLWHRVLSDGVWGDLGAVAKTIDGQLVVVGRVAESGFPSNDLWCAKLDATHGRILWQRAYEGELGDFGSAILPLANSGFVVGGIWGWGFEGESIWLQRTDRSGDLPGCKLVRSTAFATLQPALSVKDGIALRALGSAQTKFVGSQIAPSQAKLIELCR